MFDLAKFIQESNLIDPQLDIFDNALPGMEPGDLLFDNQLNAFNLAKELAKEKPYPGIAQDLHRELTRNVPFFEERGCSGRYRNHSIHMAGSEMPAHYLLSNIMKDWLEHVDELLIEAKKNKINRTKAAWWCHHAFECIHPFSDGNGRTGRLLLNWFRMSCQLEPIVIQYKKRFEYYDSIQVFRNQEFPIFYNKCLKQFDQTERS
jgi:Fic family protein